MGTIDKTRIEIDETLEQRVAAIANAQGMSATDFAKDVLMSFVEDAEAAMALDTAEDERRWQEYRRTGEGIPFEEMHEKLRRLADEAAMLAEKE